MKKVFQIILILLLTNNICKGQQFVNGTFDHNANSWITSTGSNAPDYFQPAGNGVVDLTPYSSAGNYGATGNGAFIKQVISFSLAGCYMISFDLGTFNDGAEAYLQTAGVDVEMETNGVSTSLGHFTVVNNNGTAAILKRESKVTASFSVTAGNYTFKFTGNNGYAHTGRVMGIDNISLSAIRCPSTCHCNTIGQLPIGVVRDGVELGIFPGRQDTTQVLKGDQVHFEIQVPCSNQGCGHHLAELISPSNQVVASSPSFLNNIPLVECGVYKLRYIVRCGQEECEKDSFFFKVHCCECPPAPDVLYTIGNDAGKEKKAACTGNKKIAVKCQQQVNIRGIMHCVGDGCTQSNVMLNVEGPGVSYTTKEDEYGFSFIPLQKGDYVVTVTGSCNGKSCNSCKIIFHVDECICPPPPCCKTPVQVTFNEEDVKFQYAAETRLAIPLQLNGGANKFTQVRADVVAFNIYSDNVKCMDCYDDSQLWGSIYSGSLEGFTATYPGKNIGSNVNTREVVFNTNDALLLNNNLQLHLFLPQATTFTCCNVYADIYIKITYRDTNCNECDTIIALSASLLKPGGNKNSTGDIPVGKVKSIKAAGAIGIPAIPGNGRLSKRVVSL